MARKQEVIVTLVDDIDGTTAVETIPFSVDGVSYEIDLSRKNAKSIRTDFDKWSAHARKAKSKGRVPRRKAAAKPAGEAAAIRTWAAERGIEVPTRGRIPKAVAELYKAS